MPAGASSKLLSEKPLLNCQVCCTSIPQEDRVQIAEWAEELGAEHALDLTSDVTHLIVGDSASAKYQYVAKERDDVRVLLPEFIAALRQLWISDEPIDLHALEEQYKCPPLYSTRICMTGFEDQNFRLAFERSVVENGGVSTGDLTKEVTHLVACTASGKKYEYATAWGLKVVSLKWYKDTLQRGMQLDETLYHPGTSPAAQGIGAWNKQVKPTSALGKRLRNDQPEQKSRKLRRTASARLGSQRNDLWNDIVGPTKPVESEAVETPLLRPSKSMPNIHAEQSHTEEPVTAQPQEKAPVKTDGIFSGKSFFVTGFDSKRQPLVANALAGHGGNLCSKLSELQKLSLDDQQQCILILPHDIEAPQLDRLEKKCGNIIIVTEHWIEWCIKSKVFVPPQEYLLGLPVVRHSGTLSLKDKTVNATGFEARQLLHISKTLTKLGAVYHDIFTQDTSLIICNSASPRKEKLAYAKNWNIPVVSEKWLWTLIRSRRLPPIEAYSMIPKEERPEKSHNGAPTHSTTSKQADAIAMDGGHDTIQVDNSRPVSRASMIEHRPAVQERPNKEAPESASEADTGTSHKRPQKKKLFQVYQPDQETAEDFSTAPADPPQAVPLLNDDRENTTSRSAIVEDFLQMKAAAEAKRAAVIGDSAKPARRKLIGRAASNLSSTSRASDDSSAVRKPLSRASSINSMNTDGLGVSLSALARTDKTSKLKNLPVQAKSIVRTNNDPWRFGGSSSSACPTSDALSHADFFAELTRLSTSQLPNPPQPVAEPQMGYADSDVAAASKAKWSAARKSKEPHLSREESDEQRQREWREVRDRESRGEGIVKDDEALLGPGRVTRGRERALNALHQF